MNNQYASSQSIGSLGNISSSSEKVQIILSARNLLDLDVFSKSDPYVKVYFKRTNMNKSQTSLGKTETVPNTLNPNWQKTFIVDYIFQAHQEIRFDVFDEDDGKNDDFIGSAATTIGALVGAQSQTSIIDLLNSKNHSKKPGKLIVRVQPCQQSSQYLKMKWKARKLMNTDSWFDFWDKSDPYLKFLKIRSDNTFVEAARTQVVMDNLNPSWRPIQVNVGKLVRPESSKFKIQCWDWQEKGQQAHQYIGEFYTTMENIEKVKLPAQFKLTNPKAKNPGWITLENCEVYAKPSFMEYLRGGLQLNLSIAIDFTGSNGIPTSPSSLHYMDPYKPNQYQIAIDAVAKILLNYDSDQRIPAFGFGAKPHFPSLNSSMVSHCFPLSGNPTQIQAYGYEHLMNMYTNAIQHVELAGPTYFAPILRQAINIARMCMQQGTNVYQILLILTDGQIHDMDQSVNLLVNNSELPLSLIIVGVGSADFTNMQRLDGDSGLYASNGKKAQRDIVQFVPFRQVKLNPDLLAQQLLAELPNQVVQYMTMIGKKPGNKTEVNIQEMIAQKQQVKPLEALKGGLLNLFISEEAVKK